MGIKLWHVEMKLWHMDFTCLLASSPSECPCDPLCFEDAKMLRYCPSTDPRPNLRSEKCPQKQLLGCLLITMAKGNTSKYFLLFFKP